MMKDYFDGKKLYGDDFSIEEIEEWYRDEQEGYAKLSHKDAQTPIYVYHSLNWLHGFRHLPDRFFADVLGFGSAFGEEFTPLLSRIGSLSILDPSDHFVRDRIHGVPVRYVKPSVSGVMPFPDQTFDLISCLGVLHHIPNVSLVMSEFYRCLKPGGLALVREPIISMGDWRYFRPGLSRRERGIPQRYLIELIIRCGFIIQKQSPCVFPPLVRLVELFGIRLFNNAFATYIDHLLSVATLWNSRYHRTTVLQKFAPMSFYFILSKESHE